ncbi:MAG: class I SAM-dependent methyltransferase [bacterium]|nr:class I SAM-dependent methyltransferase [bacterium]
MTSASATHSIDTTIAPDIATASDDYSRRFSGPVGDYFLERQNSIICSMLPDSGKSLKILEVGGGHLQITPFLLALGHEVHVHGSSKEALHRFDALKKEHPEHLQQIISPLSSLPYPDRHFDVVIGIRLMAHCDDWKDVLGEMCRLSRGQVIIDYPPESSFNLLYPLLYRFKQKAEGNTRPFLRFSPQVLHDFLKERSFLELQEEREFFLPMVLHRFLKQRRFSELSEGLAQSLGITKILGSPVILCANFLVESLIQSQL